MEICTGGLHRKMSKLIIFILDQNITASLEAYIMLYQFHQKWLIVHEIK
jgi:hypothetical protein